VDAVALAGEDDALGRLREGPVAAEVHDPGHVLALESFGEPGDGAAFGQRGKKLGLESGIGETGHRAIDRLLGLAGPGGRVGDQDGGSRAHGRGLTQSRRISGKRRSTAPSPAPVWFAHGFHRPRVRLGLRSRRRNLITVRTMAGSPRSSVLTISLFACVALSWACTKPDAAPATDTPPVGQPGVEPEREFANPGGMWMPAQLGAGGHAE